MVRSSHQQGFSLVEALIAIGIVVILIIISIPKFLIASLHSDISRCIADMQTISVALEAYKTDHGTLPPWRQSRVQIHEDDPLHPNIIRFYRLTTPTVYLESIPMDPFVVRNEQGDIDQWGEAYDYVEVLSPGQETDPHAWGHLYRLNGWGPDGINSYAGGRDFLTVAEACPGGHPQFVFNPTNGLMSYGDVVWVGSRGGPFLDNYCPIQNGF